MSTKSYLSRRLLRQEDRMSDQVLYLDELERGAKAKPTLEYMLRPLRVKIDAMRDEHSALIAMMTRLLGELTETRMRVSLLG